MSTSEQLPGFREKRKILFGANTSPEEIRRTGERFMGAERFDDALEFFARCNAEEQVRNIARIAVQTGDTALLLRAKTVLGERPTEAELSSTAANAEREGRKVMAYVAHLKAGHQQKAEALREELQGTVQAPLEETSAPSSEPDNEGS